MGKRQGVKKPRNNVLSSILLIGFFGLFVGIWAYYSYFAEVGDKGMNEVNSVLVSEQFKVFEPVLPDRTVSLPQDFQFHPEYQHEWWHYFATLEDATGKDYSVQWSFFRIATDERETRGWQSPQIYISNVVITSATKVWKEQRLARGGIGQAGMTNRPFRIWIDNWNWRALGATPFPGRLSVETDTFGLELDSVTKGPYVLNGENGYQKKHDLLPIASYNFSAPFLALDGTLKLDGAEIEVSGTAWLHKEWGSGLLGEGQQGWDWFVFNLDDGSALSVSRYRNNQQMPYVFGTLATRSGKVYQLSDSDIDIKPLPNTTLLNGRRMPLQWIVNVPQYEINLTTRIQRRDMWLPFVIPYWEGPIMASGSHEATGFMQLTGY
ncbi:carotenoid 1,2-hydratase [Vibrio sp. D404a]|uniref:lipocalin-like domain-containing protein n=1 Tax=unclassified Vibrio TaxID=2614977 RepID=UPI0025527C69|nr:MULTISPECIES: lipocalin-like domain-containing protein [unclassified Vibrio]MDK9738943.1 carotenoid 1,2-hydratase [Vibrio sp. D404a]MDK9799479.1 carotenoid 1,2-hydratase [Vibrio sp. D449a]